MTADSDEEAIANHGLFSPGGDYSRHPANIGIGIFLLSFTALISYPLFIYAWIAFKRNHHHHYFQQRGVRLIVLQTIVMFAHNCILSPIKILYDDLQLFSLSHEVGEIIEHTVDGTLLLALALMLTIRIWLVNYNHQLQVEMANATWKHELIERYSISKNPHVTTFYAQYRNTYGSLSFLSKIVGAIYMRCILVMAVLDFVKFDNGKSFSRTVDTAMLVTFYTLCIVLTIVIWFKFPKFNDNLFIRQELKESIIFIVSSFVFGVLLIVIGWITKPAYNISTLALMVGLDGLCYITVLRVIQLNSDRLRNDSVAKLAELSNQDDQLQYTEMFTLQSVVQEPRGYTEFMKFLVKDFASESLCFATEYCQFRDSLNLDRQKMQDLGCNLEFNPAFSPNQPSKDDSECEQMLEGANNLYQKYIASEIAPYEINVSYRSRVALAVLLDDECSEGAVDLPRDDRGKTIEILVPIFEQILLEILVLLSSTFTRFQMSDQYVEMCRDLIKGSADKEQKKSQDALEELSGTNAGRVMLAGTHSTSNLLSSSPNAGKSPSDDSTKEYTTNRFMEMSVQSMSRSKSNENDKDEQEQTMP